MKKGNPRVIHTLCSSYLNEEFEAFKVEMGVTKEVKKCLWYKSDYSTGCNNSYSKFTSKELNSFNNCPFCGGEIEVCNAK